MGHNYIGENCIIGHNYIGHNYKGENCIIGHNYIGMRIRRRRTHCSTARARSRRTSQQPHMLKHDRSTARLAMVAACPWHMSSTRMSGAQARLGDCTHVVHISMRMPAHMYLRVPTHMSTMLGLSRLTYRTTWREAHIDGVRGGLRWHKSCGAFRDSHNSEPPIATTHPSHVAMGVTSLEISLGSCFRP